MDITWGSRKWQVLLGIFTVFILGYGTLSIVLDLSAGLPIWWYNLSFVLFSISSIGLLLLVIEGKDLVSNIIKYGLHPEKHQRGNNIDGDHHDSASDDDVESDESTYADEEVNN